MISDNNITFRQVIKKVYNSTLTALRVTISAGSALIGKVSIDQTTPGTTNGVVVNSSALPTSAATASKQDTGNTSVASVDTKLGEVGASPTANTVLDRLKALITGIVLAAGTALIGKVGIDQTTPGTTNAVSVPPTKTIQTELIAITAVEADVQSISSILALAGIKRVTIFIDHAKDNASASVGQGTEYVVQVSEKATGNDTWRSLASFTALITVPVAMIADAEEAAGQTVIECGAALPAVGDILFFKHATIGNSEWATVIARVATGGSETVTLESALTTTQAQGTYYTQGEQFVITLDVSAKTRLRVVCNNTKGTTNRAIVWRCAAITSTET